MKTKQLETKRLFSQLSEWLKNQQSVSACGLGLINSCKTKMTNPRFFVVTGEPLFEPCPEIDPGMASASLFHTRTVSSCGVSGCVCYDIMRDEGPLVLCIVWIVELLQPQNGPRNRFNVRVFDKKEVKECNQDLYIRLVKDSETGLNEISKTEMGFELKAKLSFNETKDILIVECNDGTGSSRENGTSSTMEVAEPVKASEQTLREICNDLVSKFDVEIVYSVGINNFTESYFGNFKCLNESGRCLLEPCTVLAPHMGTPSLFVKKEFATIGVLCSMFYDIGDTDTMVGIMFTVPFKIYENSHCFFNVHCLSRKPQPSEEEVRALKSDWEMCRNPNEEQVIERTEMGFKIVAKMKDTKKGVLMVNCFKLE